MRILRDLATNLRYGTALAFFLPVRRMDFRAGVEQLIFLSALGVAMELVADYLIAGTDRVYNYTRFGNVAVLIVAFLVGCYLVGRLNGRPQAFLRLTVAIAAAGPIAFILHYAGLFAATEIWGKVSSATFAVWLVLQIWYCIVALRAIRIIFDMNLLRSIGGLAVFAAVSYFPVFTLPWMEYGFWYDPSAYAQTADNGNENAERWDAIRAVNPEDTYYAQPRLMKRALRALKPQRKGVPDLYFVGFAGDATQDVFIKELRSVARLMDGRFDTAGRSITLINHADSVAKTPLANAHNLEAALKGVAARMNREEDVLFLYLTSHGSREHELVVTFPGLRPNWLPAPRLAAIVDRTGIKWRVIVISACYSGGFIDDLANENTLVITAARRDRSSFGCGDDFDFTYFGKAYFDEALRGTFSFTEAFETAKVAIAARERQDDRTPSEPQISIGAAIGKKLAEIEARLTRMQRAEATPTR